MFIGIVASGGNPLAAAAGLLVNARHIPSGDVRDLVGQRAASFLGCHIMNDESVVFGLSQKTRAAAGRLLAVRPGVALIWPLGAPRRGRSANCSRRRKPLASRYSRRFCWRWCAGL
jgi:predicted branched-subunit amino acid permease